MRRRSDATRSTSLARALVLSTVVLAAAGAAACGGSEHAMKAVASRTPPHAASPTPVATASPPRPTRVAGGATYRSGPAPADTIIALGRNPLSIDTVTGAARQLIAVFPNYVPFPYFKPSPDGTVFAYSCTDDGSGAATKVKKDLCLWGGGGASVPPIVTPADLAAGEYLSPDSWSPDGRWLVFRDQLHAGLTPPAFWTYILELETLRFKRAFGGMTVGPVRWSPDSTRLAAGNAAGVFVVRAETGEMVNVATSVIPPGITVSAGDIAWSADGAAIAFTLGEAGHYTDKLYVASADGATARKVGAGGTGVVWSPDGRWIARSVNPLVLGESGCQAFPCRQLWIARADGSDDRRIANGEDPSWSPDSERIGFRSSTSAGQNGLYVTRINGGDPGMVSGDVALTSSPSITWGGDGRQIIFTAYPAELAGRACGQGGCADGYLFTVDATGASAPRQLYNGPIHEIVKR